MARKPTITAKKKNNKPLFAYSVIIQYVIENMKTGRAKRRAIKTTTPIATTLTIIITTYIKNFTPGR